LVSVYRLPPVGRGQFKKWGLILSSIPLLIRLRRQYDLIFVSGFRIVGITAVLISKLLGKGVILKADSQGEMSGDFFKDGLARFRFTSTSSLFKLFLHLRNSILKRADAFSVITADIAAELTEADIKAEAIYMIPNSVDTDRFHPISDSQKQALRAQLGLPLTNKIVTYTGRLVSYKGLPLLLRVWQALQGQYHNLTLVLVGTGGLDIHNCEAELKAYVQEHGLQSSVLFTGSVHNVPEYLQASDIFAFPTENDAFPSSLVEAMTCQLPVITTPVGAIKQFVQDEYNGLMVQPGDFQQLYEALDRLLMNPSLASCLGEAAWQTVQKQYSAAIVGLKYMELFQAVTASLEKATVEVEA
jgi:glycosyltransferase involved in cell wall biosynthesis